MPGGGSSQDSAATKAWLTEIVPEMHYKSASDVCTKVSIYNYKINKKNYIKKF